MLLLSRGILLPCISVLTHLKISVSYLLICSFICVCTCICVGMFSVYVCDRLLIYCSDWPRIHCVDQDSFKLVGNRLAYSCVATWPTFVHVWHIRNLFQVFGNIVQLKYILSHILVSSVQLTSVFSLKLQSRICPFYCTI